ncbi:glycosyltransferase family 2 protein [Nocardia sp. NPDC088792]|uniref:glycosyltransferase family 2 protein n=1 Tax=Nocardia sp. NPDC088792 TaxID=3364332 RepID=UPI0037FF94B5
MTNLSICVPAYNAERTIGATLRSILSADDDFEVVVLDNASTDETHAIASSFADPRLRVLRNDEFLAIGGNWNRAVRLSTGKLVKIVCADDVLLPGSLRTQLDVMSDPSIAVSSGKYHVIDEHGGLLESGLGIHGLEGRRAPADLMRVLVRSGPAHFGPTAAAMFRRAHFDLVGGIRGDVVFPMDVDLFARVASFGVFHGISAPLAAWRNSPFNLCSRTSTASKLADLVRFQHRLRSEYPGCVDLADVLAGDGRVLRTGLHRLSVRGRAVARVALARRHT